jgi:hypothetical protein
MEAHDIQKETGERLYETDRKNLGTKIGNGRSYGNWSSQSKWRRSLPYEAVHRSRRTQIRSAIKSLENNLQELDKSTLPLSITPEKWGLHGKSISWKQYKTPINNAVEVYSDDENDEELPNETEMIDMENLTDEQLLELITKVSTVEY